MVNAPVVLLLAYDAADRVVLGLHGAAVAALRHECRAQPCDAACGLGALHGSGIGAALDDHLACVGGVVGGAHDAAHVAHAGHGGHGGAVGAVRNGSRKRHTADHAAHARVRAHRARHAHAAYGAVVDEQSHGAPGKLAARHVDGHAVQNDVAHRAALHDAE